MQKWSKSETILSNGQSVQDNEQGYDEINNWKYSIWVGSACID
jgi:hypothetical protein